jgi:hypothetical protein
VHVTSIGDGQIRKEGHPTSVQVSVYANGRLKHQNHFKRQRVRRGVYGKCLPAHELDDLVRKATKTDRHQFIAVIDTWITVAVDTHTKYGTWATATHL